MVLAIQIGIILMVVIFAYFFAVDLMAHKEDIKGKERVLGIAAVSNITLFFDTLGIGCYAPMTASFKFFKLVKDRYIPGTLNTACVVSMAVESLIYITVIEVETVTLVTLIVASSIGAFLGAGIVSKLPVNKMRLGMGAALLVVAIVMLLGMFDLMPIGGEAIGIAGFKLVISAIVCFVLGALMTIGIGAYAPIMALVYLMGLSPAVAFPIMMGACAFLIPAAGIRFVRESSGAKAVYDRKAALVANTIGIGGIFVAAFLVKSMPLGVLKWLVVAVIIYTGIVMLRDGLRKGVEDEPISTGQQSA